MTGGNEREKVQRRILSFIWEGSRTKAELSEKFVKRNDLGRPDLGEERTLYRRLAHLEALGLIRQPVKGKYERSDELFNEFRRSQRTVRIKEFAEKMRGAGGAPVEMIVTEVGYPWREIKKEVFDAFRERNMRVFPDFRTFREASEHKLYAPDVIDDEDFVEVSKEVLEKVRQSTDRSKELAMLVTGQRIVNSSASGDVKP